METGKESLPGEEPEQGVKRRPLQRVRRPHNQVEPMSAQVLPPEIVEMNERDAQGYATEEERATEYERRRAKAEANLRRQGITPLHVAVVAPGQKIVRPCDLDHIDWKTREQKS